MKHADMIPLMGKVVTVSQELRRGYTKDWKPRPCPPWAGWIVGFTYKLDGTVDEDSTFRETSRQLCVLVKPWPTMKGVPVPLDGYTLGGKPEPPDNGGWRAFKKRGVAVPF